MSGEVDGIQIDVPKATGAVNRISGLAARIEALQATAGALADTSIVANSDEGPPILGWFVPQNELLQQLLGVNALNAHISADNTQAGISAIQQLDVTHAPKVTRLGNELGGTA